MTACRADAMILRTAGGGAVPLAGDTQCPSIQN
jgi:hypothetical protein